MTRIDGTIKTLQPVIHSGNTADSGLLNRDNLRYHRKIKVWHEDGPAMVPVISGNSIRGIMRRLGAESLLKQLELQPDQLSPKLYYLLYAGGALEKGDKKGRPKASANESPSAIQAVLQELRTSLPLLSLLGCAYHTHLIDSRLNVDFAVPYVDEVAALYDKPKPGIRADQITDWIYYTRMDDMEMEASSKRMIYQYEYIVPFTEFMHGFTLIGTNEIESSLFSHLLQQLTAYGYVGGKSAQGHGKVIFNYGGDHGLKPEMYVSHIEENKREIIEFMRTLWR